MEQQDKVGMPGGHPHEGRSSNQAQNPAVAADAVAALWRRPEPEGRNHLRQLSGEQTFAGIIWFYAAPIPHRNL